MLENQLGFRVKKKRIRAECVKGILEGPLKLLKPESSPRVHGSMAQQEKAEKRTVPVLARGPAGLKHGQTQVATWLL